jgi:hypothetical protein
MTWWLDPKPDWSSSDCKKVLEVVERAYEDRAAIDRLASAVGVDPQSGPPALATPRDTWTWLLSRAASAGSLLYLLQLVLADSDVLTFHEPLRSLLRGSGLDEGELQGINDPRRGFLDPREAIEVPRNAQQRTALIEVGGVPKGTGFLIGADLIVTAAHVISIKWPLEVQLEVVAWFDRLAGTGAPAESGTPVKVVDFIAWSPPTHDETLGRYQAWNAAATNLDYVICKLVRPIGAERGTDAAPRGSYTLRKAYDFDAAIDVRIQQHPLAGAQQQSRAWAPFTKNANGTRVRYNSNTLPGSSGSACYDHRGRLIAIHHFAAPLLNQGVPIAAIAADLIEKKLEHLVDAPPLTSVDVAAGGSTKPGDAPDPFKTLHLGRKPFVNRDPLRERLRSMFGPQGRILAIEGSGRAGKSYTFSLLAHIAEQESSRKVQEVAPHGVMAHLLNLDLYRDLGPGVGLAEKLMQDILQLLGVESREASPFAQQARTFNDIAQWLPTHLKKQRAVHWLFIDHLDRFVFRDGATELFQSLTDMLEQDSSIPLRVVLVVGENAALGQQLAPWSERASVSSLSSEEAVQWLDKCLAGTVDTDKLRAKVDTIYTGKHPTPQQLAPELARALDELRQNK